MWSMRTVQSSTQAIARLCESNGGQSPTLYRTDKGTFVVQVWRVTDHEGLRALDHFWLFDERRAVVMRFDSAGAFEFADVTEEPSDVAEYLGCPRPRPCQRTALQPLPLRRCRCLTTSASGNPSAHGCAICGGGPGSTA